MAKVYTYAIVSAGLMLLLGMAGFPVGIGGILNLFGVDYTGGNLSNGSLMREVLAIFALSIGGGIAVSFFTKTSADSTIVATFLTLVATEFVGSFVGIMNYTYGTFGATSWINYIVVLIFAPLTIGLIISLVDFWRGTD